MPAPSLKKIAVDQLRLGMHLHALEGAWIDHPFWKTRFVLRDPADLAKLRASGVKECWIDTAKGLDVVGEVTATAVAAATTRPAAAISHFPRLPLMLLAGLVLATVLGVTAVRSRLQVSATMAPGCTGVRASGCWRLKARIWRTTCIVRLACPRASAISLSNSALPK